MADTWQKPPEAQLEEVRRLIGFLKRADEKISQKFSECDTTSFHTITAKRINLLREGVKAITSIPSLASHPDYQDILTQATDILHRFNHYSSEPDSAHKPQPAPYQMAVEAPELSFDGPRSRPATAGQQRQDALVREVAQVINEIHKDCNQQHAAQMEDISGRAKLVTTTEEEIRNNISLSHERVAAAGKSVVEGLADLNEYEATSKKRTKCIWIVVAVCLIVLIIVATLMGLAIAKVF